ncbi:MAG: hypothetical protein WD939_02290 [Dehalococcoidia bacterium]
MNGRRPQLVFTAVAALLVAATLSACGGAADPAVSSSEQPPALEIGARWASANAADLSTLIRTNPVAFVGTVVRLKEQRDESLVDPTLVGAGRRTGSLPVSFYEVRVDDAWSQGVEPGATVIVQQAGGVASGPDGDAVRLVLEADEPLEAGSSYLFFTTASRIEPSALVTSPFARLYVSSDGRLEPLSAWRHLPGLQAVAGLGVEQARAAVESAGQGTP